MMGGPRHILGQETSKPKQASATLARLVRYFAPWWPMLLLAALFVVISTWTQVTTPELSGLLVDCYLAPDTSSSEFGGLTTDSSAETSAAASNCWLAAGQEPRGLTQKL